jgi:hypothetical protein
MKYLNLKTFIIGVPVAAIVLCLIIGPLTWANSATHFSELDDYKKTGIKSTGKIVYKHKPPFGKHYVRYVDIIYVNEKIEGVSVENVALTTSVFNNVDLFDIVDIYYKPNTKDNKNGKDVILLKSYDLDYLAAVDHPSYGKWMTIVSYSILLLFIMFIIYIIRKNNYIRKSKAYVRPKTSDESEIRVRRRKT